MAIEPIKDSDPTLGKLVMDAQRDISSLISQEIQLAKSEIKVSVKHGGVGIGLFGGAAFLVLLAIVMLSVAFAYFLNWNGDGLDLHWAFLVVFVVYVLIAALLAYIGLNQVKKVKGPERAIEQGRQIPAALKGQADAASPPAAALRSGE
jgi:hypothetical protein